MTLDEEFKKAVDEDNDDDEETGLSLDDEFSRAMGDEPAKPQTFFQKTLETATDPDLYKSYGKAAQRTLSKFAEPLSELSEKVGPEAPLKLLRDKGVLPDRKGASDYIKSLINEPSSPEEEKYPVYQDINRGLLKLPAEKTEDYVGRGLEKIGLDKEGGVSKAMQGLTGKAGEFASGLTSPTNIALMLSGLGGGQAGRNAMGLAFGPSMAKGGAEEFQKGIEAAKLGDIKGAAAGALGGVLNSAMGAKTIEGMGPEAPVAPNFPEEATQVPQQPNPNRGIYLKEPEKFMPAPETLVEPQVDPLQSYLDKKAAVESVAPKETIEPIETPKTEPETTIPESPKTLAIQTESLKQGNLPTVLVTPGESMPEVPKGAKTIDTDVGRWIYDPLKISATQIKENVSRGTHGDLLGHVEPKSEATTQTVVAKQNGLEAKSSVVSPENVERQAQILKEQFPKAKIEFGGEEKAKEVLEGRKQSGLAKGVEAKAIEKKLTKGFEGLAEYESINMKDQAQKASDLLLTDYERAKRIAMGHEEPPQGLKSFSVYNALETKAQLNGDIETLRDLATKSSLNKESSGAAQTLRILAEREPDSPVAAIQDVVKQREASIKRKTGKDINKAKETIVNQIRESVKKVAPTKETWASFIEGIRC